MGCIDMGKAKLCQGRAGQDAPLIYVIDSPEHPFATEPLARNRTSSIVTIPVNDWNDALTPWPAPGLYRGEPDFGGHAAHTLAHLTNELIPVFEQNEGLSPTARAICGYSLGRLFALYTLTHTSSFVACACLSGSVWYEGWIEHLRELNLSLDGRYAYLSPGTKERRAARPILKTVQDRMEACADILREAGAAVDYRTSPGNHLQHIPERLDAGLTALDSHLARLDAIPTSHVVEGGHQS